MTPRWVKKAMDKAISRARFENASISLPGTPFPEDDTETIREATRLYDEDRAEEIFHEFQDVLTKFNLQR